MQQIRKIFVALSLIIVLFTSSACATATQARETTHTQPNPTGGYYSQLERGNTPAGQEFGNWVVKTGHGLIQDAYVRGDDKLGVVISQQVQPDEVRTLAKSLVQGFHRNAPDRDLTVLMYAPDKKLILTAKYDNQTKQIEYR